MATDAQIEIILKKLEKIHPRNLFKFVDDANAGMGAVMRLLYLSEGVVTAGTISEFMGVSTARVAVLLKKMEARGLIEKKSDALDARVTLVTLTEAGRRIVLDIESDVRRKMSRLIDEIGMERLLCFLETAQDIEQVMSSECMPTSKI